MSKTAKLKSTFSDWISMMPYANADTVHVAIDNLLAKVAKNPQHTLALASMAEEYAYSDTSELRSAEIFLPFAKAVVANKKISQSDKNHYASMIQILENTQLNKPVRHLEFTTVDGSTRKLDNYRTQMILVVFSDGDCIDCSFTRARLSSNPNINTLLERGLLTLIYINPVKPDNSWLQTAASYPANWVVGAMPDANKWFEIKNDPTILLLDGRHKLLAKDFTLEGLTEVMNGLRRQMGL